MADKLIVNCSTGERRVEPLTDAETSEREAAAQAEAEREAEPDPQQAARTRFRDAVSSATTIADLKAALLGTETDAEPDVRPGRGA